MATSWGESVRRGTLETYRTVKELCDVEDYTLMCKVLVLFPLGSVVQWDV